MNQYNYIILQFSHPLVARIAMISAGTFIYFFHLKQ